MSDLTLRRNILDELEFLPHIGAAAIGVAIEDGMIASRCLDRIRWNTALPGDHVKLKGTVGGWLER